MSEVKAPYITDLVPMAMDNETVRKLPIPIWWLRFLQRVSSLKRGRVYNVVIIVPEQESKPVEWSFMGDGKRENEG